MYSAEDIAAYIVNRCIDNRRPITNLQLQKILYLCQLAYHRFTDASLFEDDFEARQYGPVVPSVYRMFSLFGGMKINRFVPEEVDIDPDTKDFLNILADKYSGYSPLDLTAVMHQNDDAWEQTFQGGEGDGKVIPKELMFA